MLDAYRDLIDELLETPAEIRGLIEGSDRTASPQALDAVASLRDRDQVVLERVQSIIRQPTPMLAPLGSAGGGASGDVATLLDEMDVARGDLVSILMNLTLKDWEREAFLESGGMMTLADEVEAHVEFDEAQRALLREIVQG